MKKVTSALALAALLGAPAIHAQSQVEFGGDFDVRAFVINDDDATVSDAQQRVRVGASFATEQGVRVTTRFQLANSSWSGDDRGTETDGIPGGVNNPYTVGNRGHEGVGLDLAYVDLPTAVGMIRAGRIETSWNNDFTATDDRRDRLQFTTRLGGWTAIGFVDRRTGNAPENDVTSLDDGDNAWTVVTVGQTPVGLLGFLAAYFDGSERILISPYLNGDLGVVDYKVGFNYLGQGEGANFTDNHWAGYLRVGTDLGAIRLEGQYIGVIDGGLVHGGFDTFSSLVNNNPDHYQNPLNVTNIGGAGFDGQDRHLLAVRAGMNVTPSLRVQLAGGWMTVENPENFVLNQIVGVPAVDEDATFVDLQAFYQVNNSTELQASLGHLMGDDLLGTDTTAGMLTLRTSF